MADYSTTPIILGFYPKFSPPPVPPVPRPWEPPNLKQPLEKYEDLSETITKFLGYRPTEGELDEFPYDIYTFLIYSLRQRDQDKKVGGTALLKRFLMGPQEIWYRMYQAASTLETVFDPETIDADYLNSLMRLLGFGSDLSDVSTVASEEEIRRIITGAIEFWRERWLDLGIDTAIRIVTGNRFKVRDYFDFRYIVGENLITEDLENEDSNAISVQTLELFKQGDNAVLQFGASADWFHDLGRTIFHTADIGTYIVIFDDTGSPSNNGFYEIVAVDPAQEIAIVDPPFPRYQLGASWFQGFKNDEYLTEVRVVDEKTGQGEVNRPLMEKLLGIQRFLSERINVVYVDFMDLFDVKADLGMWTEATGSDFAIKTVDDRVLTLKDGGTYCGLSTNRVTAPDWENYCWKTKLSMESDGIVGLVFLEDTQLTDFFVAGLSYSGFGTGALTLSHYQGGTPTVIAGPIALPSLSLGVNWTYTIEAFTIAGGVNIRVFVDGNKIIDVDRASTWTKGNIGLGTQVGTEVKVAETELWQYPLDIVRIGPNP